MIYTHPVAHCPAPLTVSLYAHKPKVRRMVLTPVYDAHGMLEVLVGADMFRSEVVKLLYGSANDPRFGVKREERGPETARIEFHASIGV